LGRESALLLVLRQNALNPAQACTQAGFSIP
jgi:hypothetical protein